MGLVTPSQRRDQATPLRELRPACSCGHDKRAHPYVGQIASWPTRCLYCDCLGWNPDEDAERVYLEAGGRYA
jgi:hypothetical protein